MASTPVDSPWTRSHLTIERPRTVEALAPGYERIHREAVARIRKLKPEDLDRSVPFFTGPLPIRDILWGMIISHGIHHRGQLTLMCRLAGGQAPGLYGPNREEMAALLRAGARAFLNGQVGLHPLGEQVRPSRPPATFRSATWPWRASG